MGPLWSIMNAFSKYNILGLLDQALKSGLVMPAGAFKKLIKGIIDKEETARFRITCVLYKSLPLYNACVHKISLWPWWIFGDAYPEFLFKVRSMYRLMVGQSCIKFDTARYDNSSPLCTLCDAGVTETVDHMLFGCSRFRDIRDQMWDIVIDNVPIAMAQELYNMNNTQKTEFIISGLRCEYTHEWSSVYKTMINFCYEIYSTRREMNVI